MDTWCIGHAPVGRGRGPCEVPPSHRRRLPRSLRPPALYWAARGRAGRAPALRPSGLRGLPTCTGGELARRPTHGLASFAALFAAGG
eukprot:11869511-Alexandrium_andersonii.AAC.1